MQRECYTYSIHPHIAIENLNKMGKKNKFITSRLVFLDTRSGRDWVLSLWRNQMSHKAVEVSFGVRLLWRYYYSLYLLFVFWWGILLFNLYLATQLCLWVIKWCYLIHVHKLWVSSCEGLSGIGLSGFITPKVLCHKPVLEIFFLRVFVKLEGFEKLSDITYISMMKPMGVRTP